MPSPVLSKDQSYWVASRFNQGSINKGYQICCLILFMIVLSACQPKVGIKPYSEPNLVDFTEINTYQFTGKISFSDGQEGGSGSVRWRFSNGSTEAKIKAPLGSKSWQITATQDGAELRSNGGEVYRGHSAQELLEQQVGWSVPWQQLRQWVVGQPGDARLATVTWVDQDSYQIIETGWVIQYSRIKPHLDGFLPHKMVARNGDYSIKLSIRNWQ